MKTWQLQEAKSKFSKLVSNAINDAPQIVTRHGKNAVVVISYQEYKKLKNPETDIVSFFQNSPLAEVNLDLTRSKDLPRDLDL